MNYSEIHTAYMKILTKAKNIHSKNITPTFNKLFTHADKIALPIKSMSTNVDGTDITSEELWKMYMKLYPLLIAAYRPKYVTEFLARNSNLDLQARVLEGVERCPGITQDINMV